MRFALASLVLVVPLVSPAQSPDVATVKFVLSLQAENGGFKGTTNDKAPGLRATSAAVRTLNYLGAEIPRKDAVTAFVLGHYQPGSGRFAEAGGVPNVTTTAVGVMACVELGVPKEKFARAMTYLHQNAKTFEEVRIAAGAVEAWGVKDCPFPLDGFFAVAEKEGSKKAQLPTDGGARETGSLVAFWLRLGKPLPARDDNVKTLREGQWHDGGWRQPEMFVSDLETCYRVMRAFYLLKEKPKDVAKLKEFLGKCRHESGGYTANTSGPPNVGSTYHATIITKWLKELEK